MSVPMGAMGAGIVKRHLVKKSKQNGRCAPLLDLLLESNDLLLANMDNAPLENLSKPLDPYRPRFEDSGVLCSRLLEKAREQEA